MLEKADRDIRDIDRFFAARGLDAGYLVPTKTGLEKSIMDAHAQLVGYFRRAGLHDYSLQPKGAGAKVFFKTLLVKKDGMVETKSSLYRPETKSGDPRIWIYDLAKHALPGNLLAVLVHEGQIYVINTSEEGLIDSAVDKSSPLSHLLDLLVGAKNKPLDDKFSEWNLRLLRSFFSEASKGEEVFLRVDRDFLDQIGQDIGGDAGFLEAVRTGPAWIDSNSSFVRCILKLVKQRGVSTRAYKDPGQFDSAYRNLHAPAYLPYLAALVRNDSEHARSYYDGLKEDLRLRHVFGPNEMQKVEDAWADLQGWTESNDGRFGYFKLRRLGGYRLIGVPRSQSILKPSDIEDLARVFVQAQVRPGQELSESSVTRILEEARATSSSFSAGFHDALEIPDFEQPIRAAILTAYTDWDGTLPSKGEGASSAESAGDNHPTGGLAVGISLRVSQHNPLHLSPLWRLPAIEEIGGFEMAYKEIKWRGQFSGTEGANSALSPSQEEEFWRVAELASRQNLPLEVSLFEEDDSDPTKLQLTLRKHSLWVLIPAFDPLTGNSELREGDLPGSGPAFLLAAPCSVSSLEGYLERERPEYRRISALGLPKNWLLVQIVECGSLTEEQRVLPDGVGRSRPKPRVIRFVGGRSIRRGYSRMYLPYDLPIIELDAPDGTRIDCAGEIEIEEQPVPQILSFGEQVQLKPLRRFKIKLSSSRSASYQFQAFTRDGAALGQAKLRVAGLGGEVVETGQSLSLDNIGRAVSSDEGLSGASLTISSEDSDGLSGEVGHFGISEAELGPIFDWEHYKVGVREMFLDALGQSGSFDYGVARELLQRLIRNNGEQGEPTLILLDLRRRGHLEIAKTHKGHIARVHSVKPTLYTLPLVSSERPVWAIAGTLRIAHWETIAREKDAWLARRLNKNGEEFEAVRLIINDESKAMEACSKIGFHIAQMPSVSVARWSASLSTFRNETFHNTMESIGSARESALRFNASKGLFTASPNGQTCELWKVRDLDTGMDNLYVLADQNRYAFVRDSRWGVWLALDEFAKWVNELPGMGGVHPLPITYESTSGTLWLPARISPPTILERVLVLCNGDTPEVRTLRKQEPADVGDRVLLLDEKSGKPIFSASRFYMDMSEGKWLAYRRVPELVARLIAEKLDAVLDET